jgi:acyl-CoA synthetase (AMP-forming)/AMP-acid ligase II
LPTHFGHGLICNCLYPWLSGNTPYILPPYRADLLTGLGALIDEHRITFMSSVPPVWRLALKLSAQAAPLIGAAAGAAVNIAFLEHFRGIAEGHFTVRRLEREHGKDPVRAAYEAIQASRDARFNG